MNPINGSLINGRRIEFLSHESEAGWGYDKPQRDSFAIIHPKDEHEGVSYPLYAVFHSAGHELYSCVTCMLTKGNHDIYHVPEDAFGVVLDCGANRGDWWWGGVDCKGGEYSTVGTRHDRIQPVERRCIATVEWAIGAYAVDAAHVYAVGNSMGGSGALGIALCRGDIFAAIKVNVPAGVRHAADRCLLDRPRPEGFSLPDPPIVVDYSAQNDEFSEGHELLYRAAREKKLALMGFFGPFGHENNDERINAVNDLVHAFDIGTVSLNEAYPVFTGASTDDVIPWPDAEGRTDSGQVNAFFRWDVLCDQPDRFEIALRLLRADEWQSRVTFPALSVADVSLRRLQSFGLSAGERFAWEYADKSGECAADSEGVPTVEQLEVVAEPRTLVLRKLG